MNALADVLAIAREMRERRVNNGKHTSPTLIAWADRIDAAVGEMIAERDALLARLERPASEDEEQHAREFLAAEYEKDGKTGSAEHIRTQPLLPNKARAVRAIAAALRQQPAPALDDAMADQIIKGNADLVPAQHQTMGAGHE